MCRYMTIIILFFLIFLANILQLCIPLLPVFSTTKFSNHHFLCSRSIKSAPQQLPFPIKHRTREEDPERERARAREVMLVVQKAHVARSQSQRLLFASALQSNSQTRFGRSTFSTLLRACCFLPACAVQCLCISL